MSLKKAFEIRYPNQSEAGQALRERVRIACQKFLDDGLGDNNAEQKLCSPDDARYWQQLSEVLLADQLAKADIPIAHPKAGPDFLVEFEGCRIWIEVICPQPTGIPADWLNHTPNAVVSLPHEAILLRWTAAIKEKAEKLLGNSTKNMKGYIEKGIVAADDAYVIAVNGRLLRSSGGVFPQLFGVSQFPFAVEATFAVGPFQIHIARDSLRATGSGHQHRPLIPKPARMDVPADTFLDPRFAPISAIWAVDIDEQVLVGDMRPMVVVHNPNARNPIPRNLLPAQVEYIAKDFGDHYQLDRVNGRHGPLERCRSVGHRIAAIVASVLASIRRCF